jgi:hypothetical protein
MQKSYKVDKVSNPAIAVPEEEIKSARTYTYSIQAVS